MIQRYDYCDIKTDFDVYKEMQKSEQGDFVYYEEHLAEITALSDITYGIERSLRRDLAEAKKDLALNASMLAKQTDMAREAETEAKHLRNALENIRYNTRDNNAFMIAEDALKEQP